uniref:Uncharacterized protein n=1 Tax=Meloidogyne enterolobii TaxID=390850 RepID=A0A6V7VRE0_MELEN|nr:unnamed protein product [Meloidogyne enterolobii]
MLLHTNRNIELTGNIKFNIIIVEAEEVFMSFRESKKFKYVAICKEIFKNGEMLSMLKDKNYDLGIAEASEQLCAFMIFNEIGINKTINLYPSHVHPHDLILIGIDVDSVSGSSI